VIVLRRLLYFVTLYCRLVLMTSFSNSSHSHPSNYLLISWLLVSPRRTYKYGFLRLVVS
jgi:hypothetical protein